MDFVKEYHKVIRLKMKTLGIKSRMVKTSVTEQHLYDIKGKGTLPTIVVLHGIGGGSTPFEKMLYILQRFSKRILVPEAPGHGFSQFPTDKVNAETVYEGIASVLDSELDDNFIIFGNSMGGAIAIKYALENPEKVLALSLCSPGGAYMTPENWANFLNKFRLKDKVDAINFMNSIIYKPSPFSFLLSDHILETVGNPFIQELINNVSADTLFTPEQLASLKMPIQLIWGKADRLMLKEHLDFYKKYLPKQTIIEEPEDFGHCPFLDRPVELSARVINFIQKVDNELKIAIR